MSFLARIFGKSPNANAEFIPLWRALIAEARKPEWYTACGVADTKAGRFDMVSLTLALAILRMEKSEGLIAKAALLTEHFVRDMEGSLRQEGIGDPTVGKQVGKMMAALGGRCGAFRDALSAEESGRKAAITAVLERNLTLNEGADTAAAARRFVGLWTRLSALDDAAFLRGEIA